MAGKAERQIFDLDANTVVRDSDEILAALFNLYFDSGRTGIERILDELLNDRGGPFDNFAGGDSIGDGRRQNLNLGHWQCGRKGEETPF
jgi:hypothetical protein